MHLIGKHLGEKVLRDVTKIMLLPRPETVQQPFQKVDMLAMNSPLMRKIQMWVEQHPAASHSTSELANATHLSERTLARRIKAASGETTMGLMRLIKLNQASEALILTDSSINIVSDQIGYQDDRSFRRTFKRVTGYTPGEYRETFKRPVFVV